MIPFNRRNGFLAIIFASSVLFLISESLQAKGGFSCLTFELNARGKGAHTLKNNCPTSVCVRAYHIGGYTGKMTVCASSCGEGYVQDNPGFDYWYTGKTDQVTYSALCTGLKAPTDQTHSSEKRELSPVELADQIEKSLSENNDTDKLVSKGAEKILKKYIPVSESYSQSETRIGNRARKLLTNIKVLDAKTIAVPSRAASSKKRNFARAGLKLAWAKSSIGSCRSTCSRNRSRWAGYSNNDEWNKVCYNGCDNLANNKRKVANKRTAQAALNRAWGKRNYLQCRASCSTGRSLWRHFSNSYKWDNACERGCYKRAEKRVTRRAQLLATQKYRAYRRGRAVKQYGIYGYPKHPTITPFRLKGNGTGGGMGSSKCDLDCTHKK